MYRQYRTRTIAIIASVGFWITAQPAFASTLTFQGGLSGSQPLGFSGGLPGIYGNRDVGSGVDQYDLEGTGFTPDIMTSWRLFDPSTDASVGALSTGLPNVLSIGTGTAIGELTLTPDAGWLVAFNTFDVVTRIGSPVAADPLLQVLDADGAVLWDASILDLTPPTSLHLAPNVVSEGAIRFRFGQGPFGISNLDFNQQPIPLSPVPEPATLALMATGLAGIWLRRARLTPNR